MKAFFWLSSVIMLVSCAPQGYEATARRVICDGLLGEPAITARLYFGRTIKGGGKVDDAAWQRFLAEAVTPRFPSGFSVFDGYGQWQQRSTGRIIQEASTVIEVAAPRNAEVVAKLEEIRGAYRARFQQESVGLVVGESCMSF
jgi:hypothetical protein